MMIIHVPQESHISSIALWGTGNSLTASRLSGAMEVLDPLTNFHKNSTSSLKK